MRKSSRTYKISHNSACFELEVKEDILPIKNWLAAPRRQHDGIAQLKLTVYNQNLLNTICKGFVANLNLNEFGLQLIFPFPDFHLPFNLKCENVFITDLTGEGVEVQPAHFPQTIRNSLRNLSLLHAYLGEFENVDSQYTFTKVIECTIEFSGNQGGSFFISSI